jgi:DNA end-binding protein Ku
MALCSVEEAVMARPIWTGAITFGLVSVPVAMYSATRDHEVSFHQFEKGTSERIRYRRVNERTVTSTLPAGPR